MKQGRLPEDFPYVGALNAADITTFAQLRKARAAEDWPKQVNGVGTAAAEKIDAALAESETDSDTNTLVTASPVVPTEEQLRDVHTQSQSGLLPRVSSTVEPSALESASPMRFEPLSGPERAEAMSIIGSDVKPVDDSPVLGSDELSTLRKRDTWYRELMDQLGINGEKFEAFRAEGLTPYEAVIRARRS